jgi:sugar lactone lactonase YvrE
MMPQCHPEQRQRRRITSPLLVVALAFVTTSLAAQSESGNGGATAAPQADSAAQARAAYRRAVAAYRQRDLAGARQEMRHAAELWPTQQVYLESAASLAAAARDTADVARWIDRLADLAIGNPVERDTAYRAFAGAAVFDAAAARLSAATAPLARSTVRLTLPDTMLHPEGVAYDGRTGRWFVGSVRQRRILAVDRDGRTHDFVRPGADGLAGVFGMTVDSVRRVLWVATTALPRMEGFTGADSGHVGVFGYDLATGRLRRGAWAPRDGSTAHTFGDVTVAPNGDVYVSDSEAPWILRLPAGGDSLVRFMTHPLFRSLQGMAITADGATMFVADYAHGLLRVDLAARTVASLPVTRNVTALGVDGLYLHRGALIAVQNGVTPARLVRFCLDADARGVRRAEVLDRNPLLADEPTLGTIVGDSVFYVATSQWDKFDGAGRRVAGTTLRPASMLGVALKSASGCRP